MGETAWMKSSHSSQHYKYMLKVHARTPPTKIAWNSGACAYVKNC